MRWLLLMILTLALAGCAMSERKLSVVYPGGPSITANEKSWLPWVPGEWDTTITLTRMVDGRTQDVTSAGDKKTKNTIGNLFSTIGGVVLGWIGHGVIAP